MSDVLLDVQKLTIAFGKEEVVKASSFCIRESETLALLGISGSGKTLTASALTGILPDKASVSGKAFYRGWDLLAMTEREWRAVRGTGISMVFQNPAETLNPSYTASSQIRRVLDIHHLYEGKSQVEGLLSSAGLGGEGGKYPFELSEGMRQRLALLLALAPRPRLLIADEMTSSLDKETEDLVLNLLFEKKREYGFSLLLITHDLQLAAKRADRIVLIKDGAVAEESDVASISSPGHPLLAEMEKVSALEARGKTETAGPVVLEASGLVKTLSKRKILQGVSFSLHSGERLGIMGPSGAGKTTLFNVLTRLSDADSGKVILNGKDYLSLKGEELSRERRKMQLIFQEPGISLDPAMKVKETVLEGALLMGKTKLDSLYEQVMASVALEPSLAPRRSSSLSGGEKTRLALARALAMNPEILLLDEITSSLDPSLRKGILDLLSSLPVAIVFASHDKTALDYLCSRTLTLEDGRLI